MIQCRHFIVFAVNVGNLARSSSRHDSSSLVHLWNEVLQHKRPALTFRSSYRHTGNFLLSAEEPLDVLSASETLGEFLSHEFAVFTTEEYLNWLTQLQALHINPPQNLPGRRPTLGAVMSIAPMASTLPAPVSTERMVFSSFAVPRVRGVWKYDVLAPDGRKLDTKRREGGWGAVAQEMQRAAGGRWTARALSTLNGLASRI